MAQFSSSMLLADLDYIAPSQACIKPTLIAQKNKARGGGGDSQVFVHGKGEEPPQSKEEAIKISLQDCLACSGCVTTSETILVTSQSREEIENIRRLYPNRPVAVSISDQSAASLAAALSIQLSRKVVVSEAMGIVAGFCRSTLGAVLVCDLRWAQRISLEQTSAEYKRRIINKETNRLPMIVASCPGWVCYCEKTHPQLMPLMCEVMSPQGVAGSYIKHLHPLAYHISIQPCFDRKLESVREDFRGPKPDALLAMEEAAAKEARAIAAESEEVVPVPATTPATPAVPDIADEDRMTNCVLSTAELFKWMSEVEGGFEKSASLDTKTIPLRPPQRVSAVGGTPSSEECEGGAQSSSADVCEAATVDGSGGYHQHCILSAVQDLCGCVGPSWADLVYISKRNRNHRVLPIQEAFQKRLAQQQQQNDAEQQEGTSSYLPLSALGDACIAYGFQHIQNIVRGINRKLSTVRGLTLIEMMACPEGCLNGGGQIRGPTAGANAEILGNVTSAHIESEEGAAQLAEATNAPCTHKPPRVEVSESQGNGNFISYESVMKDTEWMAKPPGGAPHTDGNRSQGGFVACRMTFHDRKAEMEEADNIVHSLKW